MSQVKTEQRGRLPILAMAALGVVYGDIGTSPLYALKEVFAGAHPVPITAPNIMGILSMVFWSLVIVVSIKYVMFIMRADNRGEGGIIALMALALRKVEHPRARVAIMLAGIAGAALFYGDGVITPAISVLSAIEGLEVATPAFKPYVIPLTIIVLVILFAFQRKGTAGIGALFGPIMGVWFATLALLGVQNILHAPDVIQSLNPVYGLTFLLSNPWLGFLSLGGVVLTLTGAEALYADMGHFGRRPIQIAWFALVLPAQPECRAKSVLPTSAKLGLVPDDFAINRRHDYCLAGRHLRRILDDPRGDATRLLAAHGSSAHFGAANGADLYAWYKLGFADCGHRLGIGLSKFCQFGRSLWHCRDGYNVDYDDAGVYCCAPLMGLGLG
jgi:hypothetical protein